MPPFFRWLARLGPANPIAVRLVHTASRRSKHLYIRGAYLGALIVVLLWSLLLNSATGALDYRQLAAAGAASFSWIATLQVVLICLLAPVFLGGTIAQEASPRTWEVLLTTPLSPAQIVLGNLLGRLFFVLALLGASLPLFALTQYFGGVPGSAILASYAVAACAALLVGALAVTLAVSRLVGRRAFFIFYVGIISYLAATFVLDLGLRREGLGAGPAGDGVTWATALNPFLTLHALLHPTSYPTGEAGDARALGGWSVGAWVLAHPVRAWCLGSSVLSVVLIAAATIMVRVGGLRREGAGAAAEGAGSGRAARTVWKNPIAWREAAGRGTSPTKVVARWLFVGAGIAWGVGLVIALHLDRIGVDSFRAAMAATLGAELAVIVILALQTAGTAISREREDGTLDLLLTTPIGASAYVWGKLRGVVTYVLPLLLVPLVTMAVVGTYVWGRFGAAGGSGGAVVMLPEAALLAPVVVTPFVALSVLVGLSWSLKSRGTLGSIVGAVAVVGVVGGTVGLCGFVAGPTVPYFGPAVSAWSPAAFVAASLYPREFLAGVDGAGGAMARASWSIGAVVGAAITVLVCVGLHAQMVRTFDATVRRLAGQRSGGA